ncbi:ComEC/Rec2 family competence protein [Romboutsia sedimentorum]|uniref:ComEC/Rec2 family competence protein n=1 Tax=Romboutsia sedimentorum TaxID=1368474 RepID=A0ABT7E798_9FIRM|nr:ComEC/Rec2 family competence protein [Romboutsia sedimentorum]MDK2562801.1 ComEC/Rec2 family competence protein [Romboutsia sedimentorum]MDK2585716.1 ComEC/Rec2 family competence protein [Romboutsia sedimentorum]
MRRPLFIIFIFIMCVSFVYTKNKNLDKSYNNDNVEITGIVKYKKEKQKYDEYKVDKFLIRDYSRKKDLTVGMKIKLSGKFKSLDDMNYEDFNYGVYLKSCGYKGLIYINNYKIISKSILYENLGKIKAYIRSTNRYLYKENSDFINSLILGEKEQLKQEDNEMFSRTGTSHIIAISGLHTGVLCALVTFTIGGINKISKLLILFITMSLYCIMIGTSPSIVRAIAFTMILYLAIFFDRKIDGISTLSLIGTFLVINNPYILYNISFQLSFLATLSIIYFYGYINNVIKLSLISLTLASNILTLPIIYYNFKGIPIISVISNMVIVPFIGIIMYMSIISISIFKINIGIAKFIAYFNMIIINNIYFLLEKMSNLDFAYIEIDNPNMIYVIIYYTAIFLYMIYKELKVMKEQKNELQGYYN